MNLRAALALLLVCGATAWVLGCPSKPSQQEAPLVAAPASASASVPRVKVEVFAVRGSASGETSLEVATKLAYTPEKCDPSQYLVAPSGVVVGKKRRMTLFRVKNVSLVAGDKTLVASRGGDGSEEGFPEDGGEHAIVIDCIDDVPDARPFPYSFTFFLPPGFDTKHASLALEGEQMPLASFLKDP